MHEQLCSIAYAASLPSPPLPPPLSSYYATLLLGPASASTPNGSSSSSGNQQAVNVIVDTGSNLLWVQCQGCDSCTSEPSVSAVECLQRRSQCFRMSPTPQ